MNLLVDPVLTLSNGERVSLPALFAAMARDEVRGFSALRPHQRPAWHMFLVQLAALSLWNSGHDDLPDVEAEWTAAMRRLTQGHEDDGPWRLAVEDESRPAFMQAPVPQGLKWSQVSTPDALDMLITARNHDLKQAIARVAEPEDWIYALGVVADLRRLRRTKKIWHRPHGTWRVKPSTGRFRAPSKYREPFGRPVGVVDARCAMSLEGTDRRILERGR